MLKYLYSTRDDGIYFWHVEPNDAILKVDPPRINSNLHDLLLNGRLTHEPLDLHGFMDSAPTNTTRPCYTCAGCDAGPPSVSLFVGTPHR